MIRFGSAVAVAPTIGWLVATACASTPPAVIGPPEEVATVEVSPAQATLSALGATRQLSAVALNAGGDPIEGKTFSWSSSATGVISVDDAGLATALAPGQSTVTATVDGVSGTALLLVEQVAGSVSVSPERDTLTFVGETVTLTATVEDAGGNAIPGSTPAWSSSAPGVISVDDTGLATAVGPGQSTVTAMVDGVSGTALLLVQQVVASVGVSPERDTLTFVGDTVTLTATVEDVGGSVIPGVTPSWSLSDAAVASVNNVGLVTARANGETAVAASVDGQADSVVIVVRQVPTGLSVQVQPGAANSGDPLSPQPVVAVVDLAGTPVTESSVSSVDAVLASGTGVLTGNASAMVVAGVASFTDLAVEGDPGPRRLAFSATGLGSVTSDEFIVGSTGQAEEIALVSGDNQSAPVNTVLPDPLTVAVRDGTSSPVSGVTVSWVVTMGQASLGAPTSVTDVNGVASATLTLGPVAEVVLVEARVQGLTGSPVQFTATATAPPGGDTVYTESFAVADGSAWPAPWEEIPESAVLVAEVQDGRARFSAEDGPTVADRLARMRHLGIDEQDAEIELTVEFSNIDRQGLGFYFRHSGGFLTRTNPPGEGYAFFIEGGSRPGRQFFGLWTEIDGVERRHTETEITVQNNVVYRVRYQVQQMSATETRQRGKIWLASDQEPSAWTVEATTTFAELQNLSGGMILDMFNYGGITDPVIVDDIVVTRLTGNP